MIQPAPGLEHYARELGAWLDELSPPWDYWATLTFREAPSIRQVRRSVEWYLHETETALAFWGTEHGSATGRAHAHALLAFGIERPSGRDLWARWFNSLDGRPSPFRGRAHIDRYRPRHGMGATYYVSKYVAKRLSDYDIHQPSILQLTHHVAL